MSLNTPIRPPGMPTGANNATPGSPHRPQDPNQEGSLSGMQYNPDDPNAERRNFQSLINTVAVQRLEGELKQFIWQIPYQELPTYQSGPQPPSQRLHAPDENASPPRTRDDVNRKVYSRSAVQRYILQRLAADLNKTEEVKRDFHDFSVFRDVLNAPEAPNLQKLDPKVMDVDRHRMMGDSHSGSFGERDDVFAPGPLVDGHGQPRHHHHQQQRNPNLSPGQLSPGLGHSGYGSSTTTPPPEALPAANASSLNASGQSQGMQGSGSLAQSQQQQQQQQQASTSSMPQFPGGGYQQRQRAPRQVLDMSNFGVQRGEYLVYQYN